jgi:hypothetical protein
VTTFVEGALFFHFGDGWTVEKYDDHPATVEASNA